MAKEFEEVVMMKDVVVKQIKCWNLSCVLDIDNNLYVWGSLESKSPSGQILSPQQLCIKQPQKVANLQIEKVDVGPSMAIGIQSESSLAFTIGINSIGQLGLGDYEMRKTFTMVEEIRDR